MTTYNDCIHVSTAMNESNDCTVKALAITTGISYKKAHQLMRLMGRRNGRPLNSPDLKAHHDKFKTAIRATGRIVGEFQTPQGYTMSTIGQRIPHGNWLVFTRNHVAAMVDGVIEDWTKGRKHRVKYVIRVGV